MARSGILRTARPGMPFEVVPPKLVEALLWGSMGFSIRDTVLSYPTGYMSRSLCSRQAILPFEGRERRKYNLFLVGVA